MPPWYCCISPAVSKRRCCVSRELFSSYDHDRASRVRNTRAATKWNDSCSIIKSIFTLLVSEAFRVFVCVFAPSTPSTPSTQRTQCRCCFLMLEGYQLCGNKLRDKAHAPCVPNGRSGGTKSREDRLQGRPHFV